MKYFYLSIILFMQCSLTGAYGRNLLPELESRISLGANLTNALFITDDDHVYFELGNKRYIVPEIIEQAKKTPECWPAKDFPEGNWGETIKGIQVSLRFDKPSYTNEERINATVLVRNTTNHIFGFNPSNKVSLGVVNYRAYTMTDQSVPSKPDCTASLLSSGGSIFIDSGFQRKYLDCLNDTYDLTNGHYLIQASIKSFRINATNGVDPYEIKSAQVSIEVK